MYWWLGSLWNPEYDEFLTSAARHRTLGKTASDKPAQESSCEEQVQVDYSLICIYIVKSEKTNRLFDISIIDLLYLSSKYFNSSSFCSSGKIWRNCSRVSHDTTHHCQTPTSLFSRYFCSKYSSNKSIVET